MSFIIPAKPAPANPAGHEARLIPDPLAIALGFREAFDCFPGWQSYEDGMPADTDVRASVKQEPHR
jgi:hypothetical protein